jgi:hypothetical protein
LNGGLLNDSTNGGGTSYRSMGFYLGRLLFSHDICDVCGEQIRGREKGPAGFMEG